MEETVKLSDANRRDEVKIRGEGGLYAPGNPGGPGRPLGIPNRHTLIMEQIADTFLEAGGKEAFKKTLMNADGTMNLEALEILLKYNPALSKAFGSALGNTVNIIIHGQEAKKTIDVEVSDG